MTSTIDLTGIEFVVDDREPEDFRIGMAELGATCKRLDHHDIIVGPWGVERKEVDDFFSSIFDDRLIMQQANNYESGKRRILILEGDITKSRTWHKRGPAVVLPLFYAMLPKLTAMGVSIVPTLDMWGTKQYIEGLLYRAKNPLAEIEEQVIKVKRVGTYQAMIRQVPSMGSQKAQKVIGRWKTLDELSAAPLHQIVEIVGPATAESVWEAFGRVMPRVYRVIGTAKGAEACSVSPSLENDQEADWDTLKPIIGAKAANKLLEIGLAIKAA